MKKQTQICTFAVVVICLLAATGFAEVSTTTGSISEVTVYRGQALVTRTIDVDLPLGMSELIVEGLPVKIIPESLYAQTSGDVKVLSVRYREKAVKEDTREEVKKLDAQIKEVNNQIFHTERKKQHLDHQWSMFIKLRDFSADATKTDLNRGLLTFEPIGKLTELIQKQGQEYIEQTLVFHDKINELKNQLELLNRKRKKLDAGRSRSERQAILFVRKNNKKKISIELSYLVNGANWLPQYNLRANPDKSNALIEYNAVVNQTSGENWDRVSLSLSTAKPTMVAAAPILEPMMVNLVAGALPAAPMSQDHPSERGLKSTEIRQQAKQSRPVYRDLSEQFAENQRQRRRVAQKGKSAQVVLNDLAVGQQMIEFQADKDAVRIIQKKAAQLARIEGISVSYSLEGKLSLPSKTDQQLVNIAAITTKADFIMIATPLLTNYVYRQAEMVNESEQILLPGPANMYCNDNFVGSDQIKLVTIGEKFTAGFGVDSQIQILREFKDKKSDTLWGNRVENYEYRIAINNYKKTEVNLRLMERLPYTENESLGIEDFKTNTTLSKDAEYLRTLREKGILRWDLNLAPDTIEQNATIITYGFTMKYDNDMHIQSCRANK